MCPPDPGQAEPRDAPRMPPHAESGTDPGRAQPFESLYRGALPSPSGSHRTTARHFEPWLIAPDEEPDSEDTFHWLYRPEPADRVEARPPTGAADDRPTDSSADSPAGSPEHPDPRGPVPATPAAPPSGVASRARRRRTWWVWAIAVLVLLAAVGAVLVQRNRQSISVGSHPSSASIRPAATGPTATQPTTTQPTTRQPTATDGPSPTHGRPQAGRYAGAVVPLPVADVSASCQAPSATDDAGRRVSYGPRRLTDQQLSTAWRCNGSGVGQTVVFSFAKNSRVAVVGLVNGYAKVDPASGAHRYGEYRRIREVTWTFPGGVSFTESLRDHVERRQLIRIPVQRTDRVTLTITRTTKPGRAARSRDAVLISEATFARPGA